MLLHTRALEYDFRPPRAARSKRPLGETVASEVTPALTEPIHKSIIQWTGEGGKR